MFLQNSSFYLGLSLEAHTFEVLWEQPVGHIQGRQTGHYTLAASHRTGRPLGRQQQECCHNQQLHNLGLTVSSYE